MNKNEIMLTVLITSVLLNIVFIICLHKMCVQQDISRNYVDTLEECLGGNLDDTAGSTDAYIDYYNRH